MFSIYHARRRLMTREGMDLVSVTRFLTNGYEQTTRCTEHKVAASGSGVVRRVSLQTPDFAAAKRGEQTVKRSKPATDTDVVSKRESARTLFPKTNIFIHLQQYIERCGKTRRSERGRQEFDGSCGLSRNGTA